MAKKLKPEIFPFVIKIEQTEKLIPTQIAWDSFATLHSKGEDNLLNSRKKKGQQTFIFGSTKGTLLSSYLLN